MVSYFWLIKSALFIMLIVAGSLAGRSLRKKQLRTKKFPVIEFCITLAIFMVLLFMLNAIKLEMPTTEMQNRGNLAIKASKGKSPEKITDTSFKQKFNRSMEGTIIDYDDNQNKQVEK